jgi:NAD(P)-dependent dehydrogenase (short-subunit alcohol dehydrogenase family)
MSRPRRNRCDAGEPVAQGLIVNMIDQRIWKPTPEFSTYTIAKMGLWALTQTAAQGLAPDIRVNAIGPGPTLQGARQSAEHFARQRAATILGRGANPGHHWCTGIFPGQPFRDRPDDRRRRRPASRLADPDVLGAE